LGKLSSCGIEEEKILQWIQNFLVERRQRVVGAGMFSPWTEVFREYNNGSLLGPLLFVCYIKDLPDEMWSLIYLNANYGKTFREVSTVYDNEALPKNLDFLAGW
jgi:ribonucleases P/MRP protein subunit RPP40